MPHMAHKSIRPSHPAMIVHSVSRVRDHWVVEAESCAVPRCPSCGAVSERQHSWYQRNPCELPVQGIPVVIRLRVRKWHCDAPACERSIFAERLPRSRLPPRSPPPFDDWKFWLIDQPDGRLAETVKLDWPVLSNLRLDPFERRGRIQSPPALRVRKLSHNSSRRPTARTRWPQFTGGSSAMEAARPLPAAPSDKRQRPCQASAAERPLRHWLRRRPRAVRHR
jgi:transposase